MLAVQGDPGVDRIGLGQDAGGLGEETHASPIEQVDDEAVGLQPFDDEMLVAAAGFECHLVDAGLAQPAGQVGQAASVRPRRSRATTKPGLLARI